MEEVPDVVVPVRKELAEDVDRHNPQPLIRLDLQNRQHRLIQNRIPHILRPVRIRRHLRQNIIHTLTTSLIPSSKQPHQPQDFYLEERIGYAADVVFGGVARCDELF